MWLPKWRDIMDRFAPVAAQAGIAPDNLICAGDLKSGRPGPMMMYQCFLDLDVGPAKAVIKVDDTDVGIAEGLAEGCWTVGVALSGNATGLSRDELAALTPDQVAPHRAHATRHLARSGAHYVIDSVADLMGVVDQSEGRIARGETP